MVTPAPKPRFPLRDAQAVALQLQSLLAPACERVAIVGSVRRHKPAVGDVELLFIPRVETEPDPNDLFSTREVSLADRAIDGLLAGGLLAKRLRKDGHATYGPQIKLLAHVESGIPVDLFTARRANWFNLLVCRTGPKESNEAICMAAQERGYKWNPFSAGFEHGSQVLPMESEEAVFAFVGFECLPPEQRLGIPPARARAHFARMHSAAN